MESDRKQEFDIQSAFLMVHVGLAEKCFSFFSFAFALYEALNTTVSTIQEYAKTWPTMVIVFHCISHLDF